MAGDSTMVVRALLRDEVTPQLARIAAAVEAMNKSISASDDRTTRNATRNSDTRERELFKIDNAMRGVARRMASRVLLIGAAIAAASGQAVALTDALYPMIGALGAIPAVAFGGLAGIAALIVGLKGLGAAMKTTGGGAGVSADQIASAEHRIAQAQKASVQAQQDVNDAREQAVKDLRDLNIAYARAGLDVKEAALAVRDAELALRQARSSGNRDERTRAELALQEALLSQQEAQNRLTDTTEQYNEAQAKGVEGSDTVQTALQRQADATYELAQAQKALADAQKGGGGADAAAEAYAKLSDAGKSLVDTFKSLKPAWADVAKLTQQHLLAGVDDDIKALSTSYLPVMADKLPAIADGWNTMFHSISNTAKDSGFVADMNDALGDTATMFQRIGHAFGPLLDGFRQWISIGSDFLPRLGSWVDRMAGKFDNWSKKMRETGKGAEWIENALTAGHQFNQLLGSWSKSLFKIFQLGNKPGFLQALVDGSRAFQNWLDTAEGQDRITRMWERMRDIGSEAWGIIKQALSILAQTDVSPLATALRLVGDALKIVNDNMGFLGKIIGPLAYGFMAYKTAAFLASVAENAVATKAAIMQVGLAKAAASAKGAAAMVGLVVIAGQAMNAVFDKPLNAHIEALAANLEDFAHSGQLGHEATRVLGDDFSELEKSAKALTKTPSWLQGLAKFVHDTTGMYGSALGTFGGGLEDAQSRIDAFDDALAQMVQTGHADEAKAAFERISTALQQQGINADQMPGLFDAYFGALEAGKPTIENTADAWRHAEQNLDSYMTKLKEFLDPMLAFTDAQRKAREAQEKYQQVLADPNHTQAEAQQALEDLATAQLEVGDALAKVTNEGAPQALEALQKLKDAGIISGDSFNYLAQQINATANAAKAARDLQVSIEFHVTGAEQIAELEREMGRINFSTSGARASGGPVSKGKAYVVGEDGPEVFVASDNGTIIPNGGAASGGGPRGAQQQIVLKIEAGEDLFAQAIRKMLRVKGPKSFGLASA